MSSGILSKAISNIVEAQTDKKSDEFVMVNVRPGEKISAMLDVISYLYGKSPSIVIADALSHKIATFATTSQDHSDAILEATAQAISEHGHPNSDSALGLLEKHGWLKIKTPFIRDLDLLFADSPNEKD